MGQPISIFPVVEADDRAPAGPAVADVVGVVVSHVWLNDQYRHLVLEAPDPAPLALAGQFFNLECPHTAEDKPFLRRPMSVYKADPERRQVEFLYKVTGVGTRGLAAIKVGRTMRMLGPLGVGFSIDPAWRDIVVLGRGVGLATLAPLAEMAAHQGVGVTAILSARSPSIVMSVDRFAAIGAKTEVVLDSDGTSAPENVERILRELVAASRADAFFTCGSNRLMLLMQRARPRIRHSRARSRWNSRWPAGSACASAACASSRSTAPSWRAACAARARSSSSTRRCHGRPARRDRRPRRCKIR